MPLCCMNIPLRLTVMATHKMSDLEYASKNNPLNEKAAQEYLKNPDIYYKEKEKFKECYNDSQQKFLDYVYQYSMNGKKWIIDWNVFN